MKDLTEYRQIRDEFELDVPERFNYSLDVLARQARERPEALALLAVDNEGNMTGRYTFADMATRAHQAANLLAGLGVEKGDRVFVQLPRVVEWYDVMLGCFEIGAVPMPGTTLLTTRDIAYRLEAAEAKVAITDNDGAGRIDAIDGNALTLQLVVGADRPGWTVWDTSSQSYDPATTDPTAASDPFLLYFTSGTTAHPKMVLHTHASYGLGHILTARFWMDLGPDDLHWTVSDTGWAKAAWGVFGQWQIGAAVFQWNGSGKPDLDLILRMIGQHGITTFCAPPTLYRAFVQLDLDSYDWSTLRHCMSAGEPLNPEVIETWKKHTGLYPFDGYGQTETVNLVANFPGLVVKPGSMGLAVPGFDIEIVDDDGEIVDRGAEGHIAVRTEPRPVGLFTEYWKDPQRNAEVFRNGWYYTGDRATMDADGYIWFVGRDDDVIISAAYRIGPFEVESALIEHPAVAEAAVVGKPDPERGQIVKAFVILASGYEGSDELAREIQDHVKQTTAPYKYPREIEFVEELPKTVSGKIRRVELRTRA